MDGELHFVSLPMLAMIFVSVFTECMGYSNMPYVPLDQVKIQPVFDGDDDNNK